MLQFSSLPKTQGPARQLAANTNVASSLNFYIYIFYRRLQLPVHMHDKNMLWWPIKCQSFDNQTSKLTCPLGKVLASPQTQEEGKQSEQCVRAFCLLWF